MFECNVCKTKYDGGPVCPECGIHKDHVIRGMMGEVRKGMLGQNKLEAQKSMAILMDNEMVVTKKSFFRSKDRGEKRLRYEDIITADLDRKGWLSPGAIQIYLPGFNFSIQKKKAKKLEPFYEELLKRIHEAKDSRNAPVASAPVVSETSAVDEIKKAKELLDIGAITSEEFEEIKAKHLKNI